MPPRVAPDVSVPVSSAGETWAVGAVILNERGEAFAQRRSPDRHLFPDSWDIVGGHVEPGETLLGALAREIEEETGWRLRHVRRLLGVTEWTGDDGVGVRRDADFLVEVEGDLSRPALEWSVRLVRSLGAAPAQGEPCARGVPDPRSCQPRAPAAGHAHRRVHAPLTSPRR
ncbi:NUDIX hydrolase [Streptomyces anatolicus]|uniref:NUDIX hydrolase n=1 Tax=Streptomyces anatolicus TaxID=2675858 RepID=UPI0021550C68|nr:NUDIX domain-containing protein [Streptomyces anatolicus]